MKLRTLSAAFALAGLCLTGPSQAAGISKSTIKIGFITDMSGVYSDIDGKGGAEAIRMAIADAGGQIDGKKIELLVADHQNKADVASSKAREWIDQQHIDLLIGGTNSGTNLAMAGVAEAKHVPFIAVGPGSSALTNEHCSPYTIHYAYNTVALARGTGSAIIKNGGKTWYFLTVDYAFGHSLEADSAKVVKAEGGKVLGQVRFPLGTSDFSSYLLQAQGSKAQVLGLADAGGDFINSVKAAKEFGLTKTMKLAGLLVFINDVNSLGLDATQGLYLTTAWYWNQNDESRKWAERFYDKVKRMPSFVQAGDYSSAAFFLKAMKATNSDDPDTLMKWMKSNPIHDMFTANGHVRADGLMMHDMFLAQVKKPSESKKPWDYYNILQTLPAEKVFGPLSESTCKFVKK